MMNFKIRERIQELHELSDALSEQYEYDMANYPTKKLQDYYLGLFDKINKELDELCKLYEPPKFIENVEDNAEYLREQALKLADFYTKV